MSKQPYVSKDGRTFIKEGKTAVLLQEDIGAVSDIIVSDKEKIKILLESAGIKYPSKVQELINQPNIAVLRIIAEGWSINGNYYGSDVLKKLPQVIEQQGSIQFKNHLEEGTKLDRGWDEIVSFTKVVWYDEATKSVYAAVKFPKEKKDTGWIFNMIQEDPEMVGVSISAAVYIQEDYKFEGKVGDKVEGWAYFDSADYVIFASAGGKGIEASKVKEAIKKAQESVNKTSGLTLKLNKEDIKSNIDKVELVKEQIQSFLSKYYDNQAYYEITAVVNTLSSFLTDIWWNAYNENYNSDQAIAAIKGALDQAKGILSELNFWKNPNAQYDEKGNLVQKTEGLNQESQSQSNKETSAMTLAEFKKQNPDAYELLIKEANDTVKQQMAPEMTKLSEQVATLSGDKKALESKIQEISIKLDEYQVKEALQQKQLQIANLIKESKIDEKLITPFFKKTLESLKDEKEIKEAIEDRKGLVINGAVQEHKENKSDEKNEDAKEIDEKMVTSAFESVKTK
jgi:hypothetical protein